MRILALSAVFLACLPAFDVGFLADDFYMADRIAQRFTENPGPAGAVADAFRFRWTPEFDVFRPLTILSIQADHAAFGPRPGRHHTTNVLLWVLAAFLFGRLLAAARPGTPPVGIALATLVFGLWPASVESLGWLVAREDLFVLVFALVALRALLVAPERGGVRAVALTLSFLAKETTVVLPPLLLWTDLVRSWRPFAKGGEAPPLAVILRRHALPFALLALYFGVRFALFGRLGGTYNGRPYGSYLGREDIVHHVLSSVGESIGRLAAPVNHAAYLRLSPLPLWVASGSLLLASVVALASGIRRATLPILALLPWIIGPLAILVVPLQGVGPDLDKARFLLLPMIGWLLPVVIAGVGNRLGRLALLLLAVAGAAILRINLDAYREATRRAETAISDLARALPSGSRGLLIRGSPPGSPGLREDLMVFEGVHLLSAGIFHALRPPFLPAPGAELTPVAEAAEAELPARLRSDPELRLLALAPPSPEGPRFEALIRPPATTGGPLLLTGGGGVLSRSDVPVFAARLGTSPVTPGATLRIEVRDLDGHTAEATLPLPRDAGPGTEVRVPGTKFRVQDRAGAVLPLPLDATVLGAIPSTFVVATASLVDASGTVLPGPTLPLLLVP